MAGSRRTFVIDRRTDKHGRFLRTHVCVCVSKRGIVVLEQLFLPQWIDPRQLVLPAGIPADLKSCPLQIKWLLSNWNVDAFFLGLILARVLPAGIHAK